MGGGASAARGRLAEAFVAARLEKAGYQVVARNYRAPGGELDVVAVRGPILAFVEVKARRAGALVSPGEAVNWRKRQRIVLAAQAFLLENPGYGVLQPRFDVALVTLPPGESPGVRGFTYLKDAFGPQDAAP